MNGGRIYLDPPQWTDKSLQSEVYMPIGNPIRLDYSAIPGIATLTPDEYYFVRQLAFTQSQRHTFGAGETKWFQFDASAYVPSEANGQLLDRVFSEVPSTFTTAGPLLIDFYRDSILGTAVATPLSIPSFNRDANSSIAPQSIINSLDKAPDTLGTKFSEILNPSSAAGVGQRVGFSVKEALPFTLNKTEPIVMSVINNDGADTIVAIRWNWFEI